MAITKEHPRPKEKGSLPLSSAGQQGQRAAEQITGLICQFPSLHFSPTRSGYCVGSEEGGEGDGGLREGANLSSCRQYSPQASTSLQTLRTEQGLEPFVFREIS